MKRGFKFALLFSTMITLSSAAVAQDVVLTEESIRAYVQEAAQSARGGSAAMVSFSEKHLHEDAVLKTVTRTVIPEMEPLEKSLCIARPSLLRRRALTVIWVRLMS